MFTSITQLKYTKVSVNTDYSDGKPYAYADIQLAWGPKDESLAKLFSATMDDMLVHALRFSLSEAVDDIQKDIYQEDASVLIILRYDCKFLAAKIVPIVRKVEAEFDAMLELQT